MLFNEESSIKFNNDDLDAQTEALILEGALMDLTSEEIETLLENTSDVAECIAENIAMERTIVRLDKQAKLNKAKAMAVFSIAKEKNDPMFKKLMTVWKWERFLENKLTKKYGNEAARRAKKAAANSAKSKSNINKAAANKITVMNNAGLGSTLKYSAKNNSTPPKIKLNGDIPSGGK